jgi:WD40 repeat protein
VDIQWNPLGEIMASCSIDGSICLWELPSFSLISKLEGHKASVKGISWDPSGKYLLSQGTDQQIIIYGRKNDDWIIETSIHELLNNSPYLDYIFAKNSWSPDGKFFSITNASNGSLPCAIICEQSDLSNQISLIGHLSSVEVAKFCPWKVNNSYLIAVASQDGWISIWNNIQERPLMIISELFNQTILDIIWDHDDQRNLIIYACSYDGSICKICLSNQQFGELSIEEDISSNVDNLENRLFGINGRLSSKKTHILSTQGTINFDKNGRKRITPQLISSGKGLVSESNKVGSVSISIQHAILCQNLVSRFIPLLEVELIHEDSDGKLLFEIKNLKEYYSIACILKDSSNFLWKHSLYCEKEPIKLLSSGPYLVVICKNGIIYVLSTKTSRRLSPKLMMTGSVSGISLEGSSLFILDENGIYTLWNLNTREIIFKGILPSGPQGKVDSISQNEKIIKIILEDKNELLLNRDELIYMFKSRNIPNSSNTIDDIRFITEEEKIENVEEQMAFFLVSNNFSFYLESLKKYFSLTCKKGYMKRLEEVYYEIKRLFKDDPDKLSACLEVISEVNIGDGNFSSVERISKEFFDNLPHVEK